MNILLIDDEATLRRTLRTALETMGHQVAEAGTGPRALELCRVFDTPNVRVFSYYLPDGGRWEDWRGEVMARMGEKARRAAQDAVVVAVAAAERRIALVRPRDRHHRVWDAEPAGRELRALTRRQERARLHPVGRERTEALPVEGRELAVPHLHEAAFRVVAAAASVLRARDRDPVLARRCHQARACRPTSLPSISRR